MRVCLMTISKENFQKTALSNGHNLFFIENYLKLRDIYIICPLVAERQTRSAVDRVTFAGSSPAQRILGRVM